MKNVGMDGLLIVSDFSANLPMAVILFRKYGSGAFISSVLATDSHIHLFFVLCFCIAMANAVDVTAVVVGIRHFFAKI